MALGLELSTGLCNLLEFACQCNRKDQMVELLKRIVGSGKSGPAIAKFRESAMPAMFQWAFFKEIAPLVLSVDGIEIPELLDPQLFDYLILGIKPGSS